MHRRMYHGWFAATYSHLFQAGHSSIAQGRFWLQCKDDDHICIAMGDDGSKGLRKFFFFSLALKNLASRIGVQASSSWASHSEFKGWRRYPIVAGMAYSEKLV